jgi:hypothetical protein
MILSCIVFLSYQIEIIFSVLDATGKPGAGLKTGNIVWQGDYEECMGVKVTNKFHGKMCLATIPVGAKTQINPVSMVNKMLKWLKVSSFSSILIH